MTADTLRDRLAQTLLDTQWNQPEGYPQIWDQSAHRNHIYHGSCAICRGDVAAVADAVMAVVGGALTDTEAPNDRLHTWRQLCEKAEAERDEARADAKNAWQHHADVEAELHTLEDGLTALADAGRHDKRGNTQELVRQLDRLLDRQHTKETNQDSSII